jgi:hypothetical protein
MKIGRPVCLVDDFKSRKMKTKKVATSPYWGGETPRRTAMNLVLSRVFVLVPNLVLIVNGFSVGRPLKSGLSH